MKEMLSSEKLRHEQGEATNPEEVLSDLFKNQISLKTHRTRRNNARKKHCCMGLKSEYSSTLPN